MFKRSFFGVATLALGLLVSSGAIADDSDDFVCASDVNKVIQQQCCSKRTKRLSKKCINEFEKKVSKVRGLVGNKFARSVKKFIHITRIAPLNKCTEIDVDKYDSSNMCTSEDEIINKVSAACCDKTYKQDRLSCLNAKLKNLKNFKSAFGEDSIQYYTKVIEGLKVSRECGAGGEERANLCQTMRSTGNGFLWKGKGEAYGGVPVAVLPIFNKATSCVVEDQNGRGTKAMWCSSQSANPWNGVGRQHWRGRVKCGSMKKPSILRCKIGGKWNCWKLNNPCQGRIE